MRRHLIFWTKSGIYFIYFAAVFIGVVSIVGLVEGKFTVEELKTTIVLYMVLGYLYVSEKNKLVHFLEDVTEEYAFKKASKYLKEPTLDSKFAKENRLTMDELNEKISEGELEAYEYRGYLFVEAGN